MSIVVHDRFAAEPLRFELDDGVATLTLNRPHEGNSISPGMITPSVSIVRTPSGAPSPTAAISAPSTTTCPSSM